MRFFHLIILFALFIPVFQLNGQELTYEELAPIPLVDVEEVYISPKGNTYLFTKSKIFFSNDGHQSWIEVEAPVDRLSSLNMYFLEDDTPVLYNRLRHYSYILRDGDWVNFLPDPVVEDSPNEVRFDTYDQTLFYFDLNTFFKSSDKGRTWIKKTDSDTSTAKVERMFINHRYIYLYKERREEVSDSAIGEYINVYDHDFNLLNVYQVPEDHFESFVFKNVVCEEEVIYLYSNKKLYVSDNLGKDYKIYPLESSYYVIGVINRSVYLVSLDKTCLVRAEVLGDEIVLEYIIKGEKFVWTEIYEQQLVIRNYHSFKIYDPESQTFSEVGEFPFNTTTCIKLKIDSVGHYYASTQRVLFKSYDKGVSWQEIFRDEDEYSFGNWMVSPKGIVSITDARRDSMGRFYTPLSIDQDGNKEYWDLSGDDFARRPPFTGRPFVFSLDQPNLRVASDEDLCLGLNRVVFFSLDQADFNARLGRPEECLDGDLEVRRIGDHVFLCGAPAANFEYSAGEITDIIDFHGILFESRLNDFLPSSVFRTKYSSYVSSSGELFLHPTGITSTSEPEFFPTYYSPEILSVEPKIRGRAPRGIFLNQERLNKMLVVAYSGEHYYRTKVEENYEPFPVKNLNLTSTVNSGAIDENGRIVLLSRDGRVYRSTEEFTVSSIEELSRSCLAFYPNPVTDLISIEFCGNKSVISVYDNNGELHYYSSDVSSAPYSVDLSHLEGGVYFLSVKSESGLHTHKFVKL